MKFSKTRFKASLSPTGQKMLGSPCGSVFCHCSHPRRCWYPWRCDLTRTCVLKEAGSKTPHAFFSTQWQGETQEFCPGAKVVLVGCKMDLRTDLSVMRELAKHRLVPVTHEQVRSTNESRVLSISVSFSFSGPVSVRLMFPYKWRPLPSTHTHPQGDRAPLDRSRKP